MFENESEIKFDIILSEGNIYLLSNFLLLSIILFKSSLQISLVYLKNKLLGY